MIGADGHSIRVIWGIRFYPLPCMYNGQRDIFSSDHIIIECRGYLFISNDLFFLFLISEYVDNVVFLTMIW